MTAEVKQGQPKHSKVDFNMLLSEFSLQERFGRLDSEVQKSISNSFSPLLETLGEDTNPRKLLQNLISQHEKNSSNILYSVTGSHKKEERPAETPANA